MLDKSELNYELIYSSKIFHFGSLSLTHEPVRSATIAALEHAKDKNIIISYDPNLRIALWKNPNHALQEIRFGLKYCRILKISEEELEFITGIKGLNDGSMALYREFGIDVILVTRGGNGCFYRLKEKTGQADTFNECKTVDTTGAGDAFLGGFLYSLLNELDGKINDLNQEKLHKMVLFSNAVASISTTKKGAIPSMPKLEEVRALLASRA
jgi:fructokinase